LKCFLKVFASKNDKHFGLEASILN